MNTITDKQNFEGLISKSKKTVLVDFYADWCTPCKMMMPIIEELENELKDTITILKINIDDNPDIAQKYSVMSVPTLMLFKNGKPTNTIVGVTPKEKLIEILNV